MTDSQVGCSRRSADAVSKEIEAFEVKHLGGLRASDALPNGKKVRPSASSSLIRDILPLHFSADTL
jgi:hypothetical protein